MSKKIRILLANWSFAEGTRFFKSLREGDMETVYNLAHRVIVSWDYDVPLDQDDAIFEIGVAEAVEVVNTIADTVNAWIETTDVNYIKLNLGAWKNRDFLDFERYREEGRFSLMEAKLREIYPEMGEKELDYPTGALVIKALGEAYKKLFRR